MDNKYKKLGKNTVIVFIGSVGSKLISILMLPFYTRFLPPDEYGVTDIVSTYSQILLSIVSCCIADGILLYTKQAEEKDRTKFFTSGLCFSVFSFSICALLIFIIKSVLVNNISGGVLLDYIWWVYLMTAATFFCSYSQQFVMGINLKVYSFSGIILTALLAVFGLILVPKYGIEGYLWSIVGANLLTGFLCVILAKATNYFNLKEFDTVYLKKLLLYGIPIIPNSMMFFLVNGFNRPIMESTVGLSAVGIYAVANRFPAVITMMSTIFSTAWGLSLLEEFEKPDFNHFFNTATKALFCIMILGGCTLTVFSKLIVTIFAAPEFFEAWKYMPILTLAVVFQCLAQFVGGVFMASKKSQNFFYSSAVAAVASVAFTFLFVKFWGLTGICLAVVACFLLMAVTRVKLAWKYINEFDIVYYVIMSLFYVVLCLIVILDFGVLWNILSFVVIFALIVIYNRSSITIIINKLLNRIK